EPVIAWAKMVGLDVAPVTLKLRISAENSPLCNSSRESVSSQIETPASCSRFSCGFAAIVDHHGAPGRGAPGAQPGGRRSPASGLGPAVLVGAADRLCAKFAE